MGDAPVLIKYYDQPSLLQCCNNIFFKSENIVIMSENNYS